MTGRVSDAHLLSGSALLIPSIGVVAPLGIAPLLALVAIALVIVEPRRSWLRVRPLLPLATLFSVMALWGAISAPWSIIPGHSLFMASRLLLISAAGLVIVASGLTLNDDGREGVGRASLVGLVLGLVVLGVELYGDFPIRRVLFAKRDGTIALFAFDRGAIIMALTCWIPILYLLERRFRWVALLLFVTTLFALSQLVSLSSVVGLTVSGATFVLARRWPRVMAVLLAGGFTALTVLLPLLRPTTNTLSSLSAAAPWLRTSAHHRLVIWRFTDDRIAERPLLGWGMDASRVIPGGRSSVRDYMNLPPNLSLNGEVMPLHPHEGILQLWVELGMAGAVLGASIFTWVVWRAGFFGPLSREGRAVALAATAAALPPLLLSYGIWQAWWQSGLWFAAALLASTASARDSSQHAPSPPAVAVGRCNGST